MIKTAFSNLMLHKLLLATRNEGKIKEIAPLLEGAAETIISLSDIPYPFEIQENGATFQENAILKAETLYKHTGIPTLSDDSGLEVDALGGKPGVCSARYAGNYALDEENNSKLLDDLKTVPAEKRQARFKCVMALAMSGKVHTFEGAVEGRIVFSPAGTYGFGYDPVFIPTGYNKTFAELGPEIKNTISHRRRALEQVVAFFTKINWNIK